jgi:hypothetical protein
VNASLSDVVLAIVASSRSLGIVMTVSTQSRSSSRPRSACVWRFRPSKRNGLVTTAIVSAPSSLARLAMTGAESFRQLRADLQLVGRRIHFQRL